MFNIWINKYGLNVVLLGHQFQFARPGVRRAIARQLREKLLRCLCLHLQMILQCLVLTPSLLGLDDQEHDLSAQFGKPSFLSGGSFEREIDR
jgi:hypothetical protein